MPRSRRNPAVETAATHKDISDTPVKLSTGYWAKIRPVAPSLIDGSQALLEDPKPPMVYIEDLGRETENPSDPKYLRELQMMDVKRAVAAVDAMIMFGVELVDEEGNPVPPPDPSTWLPKLKLMAKMGIADLSPFDTEDPLDLEFMFKRFIAVGAPDAAMVARSSGVTEEALSQAERTFRSN